MRISKYCPNKSLLFCLVKNVLKCNKNKGFRGLLIGKFKTMRELIAGTGEKMNENYCLFRLFFSGLLTQKAMLRKDALECFSGIRLNCRALP